MGNARMGQNFTVQYFALVQELLTKVPLSLFYFTFQSHPTNDQFGITVMNFSKVFTEGKCMLHS